MGKVKFGIANAAEAEANAGGGYSGPMPPVGAYKGVVKRLELVKNKSGNPMLKYLIELKATPKTENAKYDGYGIWGNLNVTDQGKGWVNGFLDALTDGSETKIRKLRKMFWEGELVTDGTKDDFGHVVRIGTLKVNSPKAELPVAFTTKENKYGGNINLIVNKFLLAKGSEDEDEYDEGDDYDEDDLEEADEDEVDDDEMF